MEFVALPIDHANTTLTTTLDHLTAVFSAVRPYVEQAKANKGFIDHAMDHIAKTHDFILFKSLMYSITELAQSRRFGIISNRKRLVESLRGEVSRHRAHSAAHPERTLATRHQRTATHTHRTRTSRVPESTAIT